MTFLDAVQKEFNERLNKTKVGKVFVMGQFIQQSDTEFRFVVNPNSVTTYRTSYIPCMLTGIDTPKNIPNKDLYEWVFTLTIALGGEDEKREPQLSERKALDEFRKDLVNNAQFSVTVGEDKYNAVTTAFHISLLSDTIILSGKKRTLVSMQIGMQSGIDAFFGNDVKISLALESAPTTFFAINKIDSSFKKNKIASGGFPLVAGTKTFNIATDSSYVYNTTVFYEDNNLLNGVVEEIWKNGSINQKYILKTEFAPISNIPNRTVLLNGGIINDVLGQPLTISFDMVDTFD